jgi:hypothetical protein
LVDHNATAAANGERIIVGTSLQVGPVRTVTTLVVTLIGVEFDPSRQISKGWPEVSRVSSNHSKGIGSVIHKIPALHIQLASRTGPDHVKVPLIQYRDVDQPQAAVVGVNRAVVLYREAFKKHTDPIGPIALDEGCRTSLIVKCELAATFHT